MTSGDDAHGPDKPGDPLTALSQHRDAFMGFLMKRLHDRDEAEDVLQEFCLRILARKDQLREAERLDAWLYAVLRSVLNDHFRKTGRRTRLGEAVAADPTQAVTQPDACEAMGHVCTCIKGLIPQLRPADAELIRTIDIEGAPRATVAAELGISPAALAARLHRARAALRDRLLNHCGCCCEHGFEDCHCPPVGCESEADGSHCHGGTDHA